MVERWWGWIAHCGGGVMSAVEIEEVSDVVMFAGAAVGRPVVAIVAITSIVIPLMYLGLKQNLTRYWGDRS